MMLHLIEIHDLQEGDRFAFDPFALEHELSTVTGADFDHWGDKLIFYTDARGNHAHLADHTEVWEVRPSLGRT